MKTYHPVWGTMVRLRAVHFAAFIVLMITIPSVSAAGATLYLEDGPGPTGGSRLMGMTGPATATAQTVTLDAGSGFFDWFGPAASVAEALPGSQTFTVDLWYQFTLRNTLSTASIDIILIKYQGVNKVVAPVVGASGSIGKGLGDAADPSVTNAQVTFQLAANLALAVGDRVGIRLSFDENIAENRAVVHFASTGAPSSLALPSGAYSYPTPEVAALITFAVGMVGILVVRSRRETG